MSSQPEDGWHGGSGSGDGQAPPARNAADDAAFPNPTESTQGAEGVFPATAPAQRTPGAVDPLHEAPKSGKTKVSVRRRRAGKIGRRGPRLSWAAKPELSPPERQGDAS